MNLNRVILLGNLTQAPEVRNTASGQTVASFTIATNRVWNDKEGQKQKQAEFHSIVVWGRLAEIAGQYLTKGQLCMVEGRLQTRNWVDQAGAKHWKTEIVGENFQMGPRTGQSGAAPAGNAPAYESEEPSTSQAPSAPESEEIKIEDIPF